MARQPRTPSPDQELRIRRGAHLRETRLSQQLTLQGLAVAIGDQGVPVTHQAVGMWERGVMTPRPHVQIAIAKALGVLPSELFGLDDEVA